MILGETERGVAHRFQVRLAGDVETLPGILRRRRHEENHARHQQHSDQNQFSKGEITFFHQNDSFHINGLTVSRPVPG